MKPNLTSVPFKAASSNGFKEFNGIAKFSPAGIVVEYEAKIFGLWGEEIKEVRIALDDILDIKFRPGLFKFFSRIQIRLKNLARTKDLPLDSGKLKLKIKREDFELAEEAVEQILQYMNDEHALPAADRPDRLPPPPTSVNELFDTEKLDKKDSRETKKLKDE
jgi:hypothetical protein